MGFEQGIVIDRLVKTGNVLATLINDVMDISVEDTVRFPLEMRPFRLHSMIKEASCLAKCLCVYKGFDFELDVQSSLPDLVIGDERRAFQMMQGNIRISLNPPGSRSKHDSGFFGFKSDRLMEESHLPPVKFLEQPSSNPRVSEAS
ncbi:hypothetical protein OIU85_003518, partial [Salix viminalis]